MFLPFFVPVPKRIGKGGGEIPMNKFHAVIIVIIAILVSLIFGLTFYTDEAKAWIGGLGGGLGQTIVNMSSGFNQFLASYEPYQVMGFGGISGILLTMFLANWLWPRIQHRRQVVAPITPMQDRIAPSIPVPVKKSEEAAA